MMFQIALDFEKSAVNFSPIILIVSGLLLFIAGLFIWLGGLGFRKSMLAISGAIVGFVCALVISSRDVIYTTIPTVVGAVLAVFLDKIAITILTAVLAAAITFATLAEIQYPHPTETAAVSKTTSTTLTPTQSFRMIKTCVLDIKNRSNDIFREMPQYYWLIISVFALIFIPCGIYLPNFTSAVYCSVSGTILIFTGMIGLLIYKGALPVRAIAANMLLYILVFAVMAVFGTLEQLTLCKIRKRGKQQDKNKPQEKEKIMKWRR
ncbi:MAG: hypothetical protein ACYTBP_06885 [Planctomycetota bacterium]|jgi:hypothetical protein